MAPRNSVASNIELWRCHYLTSRSCLPLPWWFKPNKQSSNKQNKSSPSSHTVACQRHFSYASVSYVGFSRLSARYGLKCRCFIDDLGLTVFQLQMSIAFCLHHRNHDLSGQRHLEMHQDDKCWLRGSLSSFQERLEVDCLVISKEGPVRESHKTSWIKCPAIRIRRTSLYVVRGHFNTSLVQFKVCKYIPLVEYL